MKKILSMALIAMMIGFAAVSCNKKDEEKKEEPTPPTEDTTKITKNPIVDMFEIGKGSLNMTRSNFYQYLAGKGFTEAVPGSESKCSVYMYLAGNYGVETNDSVNSQGEIYYISMTIVPVNNTQGGTYEPMLTLEYAKDALTKIGTQCQMGSCNLRYWATYNEVGQKWFNSIEDICQNCTDDKFKNTTSIWIDSSLQHYDATDWNKFIGFQMRAIKAPNQYSSKIEYSIPLCFVDNRIKLK